MKHAVIPIQPLQCDSTCTSQARKDRGETRRCKNPAKFTINGRNLCGKHAGPAAIALLMKETTR